MTTTPKVNIDADLDDYEQDAGDEPETPNASPDEGAWDGRPTRIAVAFPGVFRGPLDKPKAFQFLEPGGNCIDCGDTTHQAHLRCSKDKSTGRMVGPEADHLADLRAGGWLAKTKEARARTQRQVEVDMIRGTHGSKDRPEGFSEYKAITTARLQRMWRGELRFGPENLQQIERAEMRDETGRLREAVRDGMSDVAQVMREVLAERTNK
jgi:hypothetical protein